RSKALPIRRPAGARKMSWADAKSPHRLASPGIGQPIETGAPGETFALSTTCVGSISSVLGPPEQPHAGMGVVMGGWNESATMATEPALTPQVFVGLSTTKAKAALPSLGNPLAARLPGKSSGSVRGVTDALGSITKPNASQAVQPHS